MRSIRIVTEQLSTVLASVVLLLVVNFSGRIAAADNANSGIDPEKIAKVCKDPNSNQLFKPTCPEYFTKLYSSGTNSDSCKASIDAMNTSSTAFLQSCVGGSKIPECTDLALTCERAYDKDNLSSDDPAPKMPKGASLRNVRLSQSYSKCPSMSSAALDKLSTKMDAGKKKYEDLKQEYDKATERATKLQREAKAAQADYAKEISKIAGETKSKQDALKSKLTATQSDAMQNLNKMNDAITQLEEGRSQAYNDEIKQLHDEDNACYNHSMDALQAYLKDRQEKIAQNKLSLDNVQLFSGVGVSTQQKNGDVAYQYYQFCMTHPPHTTNVINISNALQQKLREIEDRIASIQKTQKSAMEQVYGKQGQEDYNAAGAKILADDKAARDDAASALTEKQNRIYPELNTLLGQNGGNQCATPVASTQFSDPSNSMCSLSVFTNNRKSTDPEGKYGKGGADGQIAFLRMEMNQAKLESDSAESLYNTASAKSDGQTKDKAADFESNFGDYINKAESMYRSCSCDDLSKGDVKNKGLCDQTKVYIAKGDDTFHFDDNGLLSPERCIELQQKEKCNLDPGQWKSPYAGVCNDLTDVQKEQVKTCPPPPGTNTTPAQPPPQGKQGKAS